MPGYTHLQRAQPVYLSHHLLAYFWKFRRDLQRFRFCLTATDDLRWAPAPRRRQLRHQPHVRGAGAGLWRHRRNSLDAVSNRDFVLDYLSAAATCATHMSQLGGEIVVWSSEEFSFFDGRLLRLGVQPDAPEEEPGRRGAAAGEGPCSCRPVATVHGVLHGLPLTYNKDLQEDKEQLFDAIATVELCLAVASEMLQTITFDPARGWPRPRRTSSRRPPTSPTSSSSRASPSARPTGRRADSCAARSAGQGVVGS